MQDKVEKHPIVESNEGLRDLDLEQFNVPSFREAMRNRAKQASAFRTILTLDELKRRLGDEL